MTEKNIPDKYPSKYDYYTNHNKRIIKYRTT